MKKLILSSALVLALCFSFTSCREKKEADKAEDSTEAAVEESTEEAIEVEETVTDSTTTTIDDASKKDN
jgi:Flp pilus assembly protein TadB